MLGIRLFLDAFKYTKFGRNSVADGLVAMWILHKRVLEKNDIEQREQHETARNDVALHRPRKAFGKHFGRHTEDDLK